MFLMHDGGAAGNQGNPAEELDGDLWIQALTYFRDLPDMGNSERYIEEALAFIGDKHVLSPLLVLEILANKENLRFKVLKQFL